MGGEAYSGGRWWYTVLFIDNIDPSQNMNFADR